MRHVFSGLNLLTSKVENVIWWGRVFGSESSLCRGIEPRSPVRQTRTKTIIITEMLICCSFLLLPLSVFSLVFIFLNMCTPKVESVVLCKLVFSSKSSLFRGIEPLSTTWQTGVFTTFLTEMLSWISFPPWFSLQSSATFSPGLIFLTPGVETVIWWKRVFGSKSSLCRGIEPWSPVCQTQILTALLSDMLGWLSFPLSFFLVMRHVFSGLNLLTSKVENVIWWGCVLGSESSLCRWIEPRSPVRQTGILTTILTEMLDYFSFPFIFRLIFRPSSFCQL